MPPLPVPPAARLLGAVVVVFLCLTVPPPEGRDAIALDGDRPPAPTDVVLGGAGCQQTIRRNT